MIEINNIQDLSRILQENEDWRRQIRRDLLTDELLELPAAHAAFVNEMRNFVGAVNLQFEANGKQFEIISKQLEMHTKQFEVINKQLEMHTQQLELHTQQIATIQRDLSDIKGWALQARMQHTGRSRISTLFKLRNDRVVRSAESDRNSDNFNRILNDAEDNGLISEAEYNRINDTDMVVMGNIRGTSTVVYVPMEATFGVSRSDITKVTYSTSILTKIFPDAEVRPVIYCVNIEESMNDFAKNEGVTIVKANWLP